MRSTTVTSASAPRNSFAAASPPNLPPTGVAGVLNDEIVVDGGRGAIMADITHHAQAASASGASGPARDSTRRSAGILRVPQNEASTMNPANRKAVFRALSWASS